MLKPLTIVQICRRFGPVGGMERYVWELCRELVGMGHHVHVLCEVDLSNQTLPGLRIHEFGAVRPKPRWLAHIRFSHHVHAWLKKNRTPEMIIHSHERTDDHHITTFHGPPFAKVRELPLWKRFSLRIKMNLWLEQRELCGSQVQIIVPNSVQIAHQLEHYYPAIHKRLTKPIVPGVSQCSKRPSRMVKSDAGVIGFVGKEWKRKGLPKAIQIISKLAKMRPNLHFMVAGPMEKDIHQLFESATFAYTLLGETETQSLYPQLDALLHPAINEPFGMVITEALSSGVPVIVSDICGAVSEVSAELGSHLPLSSPIDTWANALNQWLIQSHDHIHYQHSWHNMALEYEQLYRHVEQA